MFTACLDRFAALSFARRLVLSLVLGALASLAFVPFNAFFVFLVSFPALYFLLAGAKGRGQAFLLGWSFAFAHLVVNLHWMSGALFVDLAQFWWVLPFALCGLPALLALYYGFAGLLFHTFVRGGLREGPLALAALWGLADLARAHLFTGLPWDIAGYVWADWLAPLQSVSLIGIEGLTLITLLAALAPVYWVQGARLRAFLFLALLPALSLWGGVRLAQTPTHYVQDVRLRLVQPDQAQAMKWRADQRELNFTRLLSLTFDEVGDKPVTHYLWPETATSYYLAQEPLVRSAIAGRLPRGSSLVTGVVRRDEEGRYYNSLIALDDRGNVVAGYDKHHLVPFGEYMPWRNILPLPMVSAFATDFTAGDQARTLRVKGLPPFSPLICYESIFSGDVAEKKDPPSFLLNVTNDGWYDGTIGPSQHFAMARPRAVEEGLPLVRIANQGLTGVVDSLGRVTARVSAHGPQFLDVDLPQQIESQTFLQKQQVRPVWLIFGFLFTLLGCRNARLIQRKRQKKER